MIDSAMDSDRETPLVVNLIGGPGTGKSTTRAGVFFELKSHGINAEEAPEYAKEQVWAGNLRTLDNQLYVFAKQHHRLFRLMADVNVIVTDSPLIMSAYYGRHVTSHYFHGLVREMFDGMNNLNFFLVREKPFNPKGRTQDEAQAREIDSWLYEYLIKEGIPYTAVPANRDAPQTIAKMVLQAIES